MDILITAMDFSIVAEDEMKKMKHDQGFQVEDGGDQCRFQETTTEMIKKEDEMKKKNDLGFGVEDEGDLGRLQDTTKMIKKDGMKIKKKHYQCFEVEDEGDEGRFQETTKMIKKEDDEMKKKKFQETMTKIKKRRPPRRCRHDDDDDDGDDEFRKQKKKKKATRCDQQYPTPQPDLPIKFRKRIRALGGSDIALVIQKCLFKTDVSSGHNRLSIPFNQIRQTFLTPQEAEFLNSGDNEKKCSEMEVMLIEPSFRRDTISLRKWEMKKASGSSTSMYVLVGKWNSVAWRNALREDETVQLWSFRINSKLCLALVKRRAKSNGLFFEF